MPLSLWVRQRRQSPVRRMGACSQARAAPHVCCPTTDRRFRDRAALIMLLAPATLVLGLRHADQMRGGAADAGAASSAASSASGWPDVHPALRHTFTPGLMTGARPPRRSVAVPCKASESRLRPPPPPPPWDHCVTDCRRAALLLVPELLLPGLGAARERAAGQRLAHQALVRLQGVGRGGRSRAWGAAPCRVRVIICLPEVATPDAKLNTHGKC